MKAQLIDGKRISAEIKAEAAEEAAAVAALAAVAAEAAHRPPLP